jgi:hypothetical protein
MIHYLQGEKMPKDMSVHNDLDISCICNECLEGAMVLHEKKAKHDWKYIIYEFGLEKSLYLFAEFCTDELNDLWQFEVDYDITNTGVSHYVLSLERCKKELEALRLTVTRIERLPIPVKRKDAEGL